MTRTHRPRNRGFTIVEMISVIALSGILASLAIITLVQFRRMCLAHHQQIDDLGTRLRLAAALRADARQALQAEVAGEGRVIELRGDDGQQVRYEIVDDQIERQERQGDKIVRREVFPLQRAEIDRFEVHDGAVPTLELRLTDRGPLGASEEAKNRSRRQIPIWGTVGVDRRVGVRPVEVSEEKKP